MAGKFIKNTVEGKRRGSEYPPEVKLACLSDMLVEPNVHRIAKKHDVPESTLRGWYNKFLKSEEAGAKPVWIEAQQKQMEKIAQQAARGALTTVGMINTRLAQGKRQAKRAEEIKTALIDPDVEDGEKNMLREELLLRPPLGDYPMANYLRALTSVSNTAVKASGVDEESLQGGFTMSIEVID